MTTLVRLGKLLLVAEQTDSLFKVVGKLTESGVLAITPCLVEISEKFVINPEFEIDLPPLDEAVTLTFSDLVHEAVKPFVTSGRAYQLEQSTLAAYQPKGQGIGFLAEGAVSWLALESVLTHEELGEAMALEAVREALEDAGVLAEGAPILESSLVTPGPVHVYMKANPFRDITLIREGTDTAVVGYQGGCAIVEADGEEFWLPVEERSHYQPSMKDAWYYFGNQDSDDDKIHDPLQALPSKAALQTGRPASGEDNWNAAPDLRKQAGHFAAIPNIKMERHGAGLAEDAAEEYEHYERLGRPLIHDRSAVPGLDPSDEEAAEDHADDIERMAKDHKDPAEVPQDFAGEYGGESGEVDDGTMNEVVDRIVQGADVGEILDASIDPSARQAFREEEHRKVFPD